jgi:F0F1-type ATP synthase membrane subunit b/b'
MTEFDEEVKEELAEAPLSDEQILEILKSIESALAEFAEKSDAKVEEMKAEFSKENETLKAELVELKSQPASPSINATVQQVELTVQGKLLKQLRENK